MGSKWLTFVKGRLSARGESREGKPFFKVLPAMRWANEREYEPIFFTFGPYHAKLTVPPSPCDHFKLQAAKALTSIESFSTLVAKIQERDSDIRDLYAEPWDHSQDLLLQPEALAHLLALDALTIVAAACSTHLFQTHDVASAALRDAFLLEHQLPLFVLQHAIESLVQVRGVSLEGVVKVFARIGGSCSFLSDAFWCWKAPSTSDQSMIGSIYDIFTCSSDPNESIIAISLPKLHHEEAPPALPTVSQLRRCGISFVACRSGRFTAITFDERKHVLILPRINVHEGTPSYLLNLIAYEVASHECPVISSFIAMMDCLVGGEEDVQLLVEAGVIRSQFGSHKDLIFMWNKMAVYLPLIITDKDADTVNKVNAACKIKWYQSLAAFRGSIKKVDAGFKLKWRMWIAAFHDTYHLDNKPWLLISIVAGVSLFVMTAVQTIYTALQYYSSL